MAQAEPAVLQYVVMGLAQIADKKAVRPLMKEWKKSLKEYKDGSKTKWRTVRGWGGIKVRTVSAIGQGIRYIPDALGEIGDRSVVPEMVALLKEVRFDSRFHIARALGMLGGPEAKKALKDLARNDPFRAVREEAQAALENLSQGR